MMERMVVLREARNRLRRVLSRLEIINPTVKRWGLSLDDAIENIKKRLEEIYEEMMA